MNKAVNNIYYKSEDKVKQIDELKKKLEDIYHREVDIEDISFSNTNGMLPDIEIDDPIYVNEDEICLNEEDIFYLKLNGKVPFISRVKIDGNKIKLISSLNSSNNLILHRNEVKVIGKVYSI